MTPDRIIGLGCMRLSTDAGRDEARALEVLGAALDAGVTLLDTASAYGLDEEDRGHNERLLGRALSSFQGDRRAITVATKGGMTRPGGRWVPDGRAKSLAASCEASLAALGVPCLDLFLLHAPDPRTPFATSVRALAELRRQGFVRAIGLCNVTPAQIEEACAITPIDAVEVALSPVVPATLRTGVAARCAARGIRVLAHTPLGGVRRAKGLGRDAVLRAVAARHGVTPAELVLAWLRALGPAIVPLPGATRPETAASVARAARVVLREEDLAALSEHVPATRFVSSLPPVRARAQDGRDGEIVLLMGSPAAGKSTKVAAYVDEGYVRLNRDEVGGRLAGLCVRLERAIEGGGRRFVLDNTYPSRSSRAAVLELALTHGLAARCVLLDTSLEDAQVNAATRMLRRHGALLGPDEIKAAAKEDPNTFGPNVLFRYQREVERPSADEGFDAIEILPFVRARDPRRTGRALIVELEGVLWASKGGARTPASPDDVTLLPRALEMCARHRDEGFALAGTSWQPEIAAGGEARRRAFEACVARAREMLGMEIDVVDCPHGDGPPACWCRKPLPGLGVLLIERLGLDPARSVHAGARPSDRLFAERLGFRYVDVR